MSDNTPAMPPDKALAVELKRYLPQISRAAIPTVDPERVMQLVVNCCEKKPFLYKCDHKSLLAAAFQAAEVGLDLATSLNHAYLVPRKIDGNWVAVFVPSAYGLADLAYRSGLVKSIWWAPVFEGDEFSYMLGDNPHIHHLPAEEYEDYDHLLYVYSVAELATGGKIRKVLTKRQIEKRKQMNEAVKQGKYSPWTDWGVEMSCVKGLRAICGMLPRSKELSRAMSFVDAEEAGKPELADTEIKALEPAATRADRVAQRMGIQVAPAEVASGEDPKERIGTRPPDADEKDAIEQEALI